MKQWQLLCASMVKYVINEMTTDKQATERKWEILSFSRFVTNLLRIWIPTPTTTQHNTTPNEVRWNELIRQEKLLYERAINLEINEAEIVIECIFLVCIVELAERKREREREGVYIVSPDTEN